MKQSRPLTEPITPSPSALLSTSHLTLIRVHTTTYFLRYSGLPQVFRSSTSIRTALRCYCAGSDSIADCRSPNTLRLGVFPSLHVLPCRPRNLYEFSSHKMNRGVRTENESARSVVIQRPKLNSKELYERMRRLPTELRTLYPDKA